MSGKKVSPLPLQLAIFTLARLVINTGIRMVYPFAPAFARGLGTDLDSVYRLVTIRNFAGFLSPLFGPLSEQFGRKPVMIGSLIMFSLSTILVIAYPAYWPFGLTLAIIALAKVIYDPAMQSHVADTVPYRRRGMVFAITEFSWALALLIGAPVVGFVIQRQGWQAPFLWLFVFGIGVTLLLWQMTPRLKGRDSHIGNLRDMWRVIRHQPVIWAAALYSLLIMAANETFFIVYGTWMESSFDLQLTALGLASGIIGGSEIFGELFAGWSVDRFGKRPIIILTGILNALVYLLIPYNSETLFTALLMLFMLFLFFEITVVGAVPLLSEIVPGARSTVMSMALAFGALGRTLGDLLGPRVWELGGFAGNGLVAAIIMIVAMIVLAKWIHETSET